MGLLNKILDKLRGHDPADSVFEKIYRFMTSEDAQNQSCPLQVREMMASGGAVDQVPGAVGDFGRVHTNPIPVNGPIGELIYISNLTLPGGIQVVGHRIGAADRVDVYELVSLDGSHWDILFFDMYHTRKSAKLPNGYSRASAPEKFILATNSFVADFPASICDAIRECTTRVIGAPLVKPGLRDMTMFSGFVRPQEHTIALQELSLDTRLSRG